MAPSTLRSFPAIPPLASIINSQSLLIFYAEVQDLANLSNLPNLPHLNISSTHVRSVNCLTNLTKLNHLKLNDTPVNMLTCILLMTNFSVLNYNNTTLNTVQFPESCLNLPTIFFRACTINKISLPKIAPNLDSIHVPFRKLIVSPFTDLKELSKSTPDALFQTLVITNPQFLCSAMSSLKSLHMACNRVIKLAGIHIFFNLRSLDASHNHITQIGHDFASLTNLDHFDSPRTTLPLLAISFNTSPN